MSRANRIIADSGLIGLTLVIGAAVLMTYLTASRIDADEHVVTITVACMGGIVASYRVWSAAKKDSV